MYFANDYNIVNELRHEYWTGHRVCETFGRLNFGLCGNSLVFSFPHSLHIFLIRCKNGNMIYKVQRLNQIDFDK